MSTPRGVFKGQFGCVQLHNGSEGNADAILTYDVSANTALARIHSSSVSGRSNDIAVHDETGNGYLDTIADKVSDVDGKIAALTDANGNLKVTGGSTSNKGVLFNPNIVGNATSQSTIIEPYRYGKHVTIFGTIEDYFTYVNQDIYFNIWMSYDEPTPGSMGGFFKSGFGSIVVNSTFPEQSLSIELETAAPYLCVIASAPITARMYYAIRS